MLLPPPPPFTSSSSSSSQLLTLDTTAFLAACTRCGLDGAGTAAVLACGCAPGCVMRLAAGAAICAGAALTAVTAAAGAPCGALAPLPTV